MGRNFDAKKLDTLAEYLLNKANLPTLREEVIFNKAFQYGIRNSDLFFKDKNIVLELNTSKTHGELGFENAKTRRKYADYLRGKQHFIIINEDLCKELNIHQGNLTIYRYYETLAIIKAEMEI